MIYIFIGQTLSGKTTLAKTLSEKLNIEQLVTYTDRPIREGEVNGIDYHFVSVGDLNKDDYFGHRFFYTAYRDEPFVYAMKIEDLKDNKDKIIVTDPLGVKAIKSIVGRNCVTIFMNTSEETIHKRAKSRGDSYEEVSRRLRVDKPLFQNAEIYSDIVIEENDNQLYELIEKLKGVYYE